MAILDRWNRLHQVVHTEILWSEQLNDYVGVLVHAFDCEACEQGLPLEDDDEPVGEQPR